MNRSFLSFLAVGLVLLFASCQADEDPVVPYDGDLNLTGFQTVTADGSIIVNITQGSEHSVVVRDDEAAFNRITASVGEAGNLNLTSLLSTDTVTIDIVMPFFEALIAFENCTMLVDGFSQLDVPRINATGVSSITITNSTGLGASLAVFDRGEINAFGFVSEGVSCESFSSKDISVSVTEGITAYIFGAGNVSYKGSPSDVFAFPGNTGSGQLINAN